MFVDVATDRVRDGATPDRSWTRTAVLVVVWWVAIATIVISVGWLITHPFLDVVGPRDDDVVRWFADQRTPFLDDVAEYGTWGGETVVTLVVAPILAIGCWVLTRSVVPALFVLLVICGVGGFYWAGTMLVPRRRPPVHILDPGLVPTDSFPSGHVGTAVALYGAVVVLTWTYARSRRWFVTPLLVMPVFVLLSRLYQGAHHLTDVLTSLMYGFTWLAVVAALVLRGHHQAAKVPMR
ncbi:MAG TPA: phosphatase PAP2 family protein [Nocardioidaceae bacterium]